MLKQLIMIFALFSYLGTLTLAQEYSAKDKKEKMECSKRCCSNHDSHGTMSMAFVESDSTQTKHHDMKSDNKMHNMDHKMNLKSNSTKQQSIVREDVIDLKTIDKNEDGKVYQDMMDWKVIADEPGKCPLCGMTLKEVTLDKAKENLLKHNYKVKESK